MTDRSISVILTEKRGHDSFTSDEKTGDLRWKGENPSNIAKPLSDIAGKSLESLSSHTNYMRNRTCMKQGCQDPPGFINLSSRYGIVRYSVSVVPSTGLAMVPKRHAQIVK